MAKAPALAVSSAAPIAPHGQARKRTELAWGSEDEDKKSSSDEQSSRSRSGFEAERDDAEPEKKASNYPAVTLQAAALQSTCSK
eukprot:3904215-Pleurochrysis_carterae.AAC.2